MDPRQIQPSPFKQTNAFAMNYALPYGFYWIFGMLCFVCSPNQTLFSLAFYFVFASTPIIGYKLLCRFRDRVCGGAITFSRGYLFTLLVYFYAALILAAAVYVYFQFFDNGTFIDNYLQALDSPEVKQAFQQESMKQLVNGAGLKDLKSALEAMQSVSPVVYAANILDLNIFLGLLLSVPTALLAMRRNENIQ